MAKAAPQKTPDPSRIRFIMVDAEFSNGSGLALIAQAIQSAVRPPVTPGPGPRPAALQALSGSPSNGQAETLAPDAIDDSPLAEPEAEPTEAAPARPRQPRKVAGKTPDVLDIDLGGDPSFDDYANEKNPKSRADRFLVVAAWLKEHHKLDAITVDHVYTCYRKVRWPTNFPDFAAPLRSLKHQQLMSQTDVGYAINHLGLARVDELVND